MDKLYFPLFVDLTGRPVLVVGAGPVGLRRACALASFGACVELADPRISAEAQARLKDLPNVRLLCRKFREPDLDGKALAVAATDDPAENDRIAALCRQRKIPVSHAGDQSRCDFFFPGIARKGNLVAGICSCGADHRRAARAAAGLREWIEKWN